LAKEAVLLCGRSTLPWEIAYSAFEFVQETIPISALPLHFDPTQVTLLFEWEIETLEFFAQVLESMTKRSTSDDCDRMFTLLSHPSALVHAGGDSHLIIEPDYRMSTREVHNLLAENMIGWGYDLDIISYARSPELRVARTGGRSISDMGASMGFADEHASAIHHPAAIPVAAMSERLLSMGFRGDAEPRRL
jgi:hypothetical protein